MPSDAFPPPNLPPDLIPYLLPVPGLPPSPTHPGDALRLLRTRAPRGLWEQVWGSTAALSRLLVLLGKEMDGKEVLEVGAGIGAASLVASRLGARVLATDVDAGAVELLKQNGELNGADIEVAKLDWHAPSLSRQFDIVLGADVCYLRRSAAPLARLFFSALRPGGIALVVDPGRPSAEDLVEACEGEGLAARTWRVERLRTGACDMAVCRVMAFFRSGGDDDAEKSCLQALDAAVEALRSDAVPAGEPFAAHYTAAVPGSDVS